MHYIKVTKSEYELIRLIVSLAWGEGFDAGYLAGKNKNAKFMLAKEDIPRYKSDRVFDLMSSAKIIVSEESNGRNEN